MGWFLLSFIDYNKDSDYVQTKDITISGTVWNDKALTKDENTYNALYDAGEEGKISGIKVMLYRYGKGVIATTTTDENGYYIFDASKIDSRVVTNQHERYIKGPQVLPTKERWAGSHYSYYVVFEYDGITYTSTPDGTSYVDITDSTAYNKTIRFER